MRERIAQLIREYLGTQGVDAPKVVMEHPGDGAHGDYSSNAALVYAKAFKTRPSDVAMRIAAHVRAAGLPEIARVEVAGPGFVNFYLSKAYFIGESTRIVR